MEHSMRTADGAWWRRYFDEDFIRLYRPLLGEEETRAQVAALVELLALPEGSTVLDLACGWGRHAVPLAEAGYAVTGVDFSTTLLDAAREHARRAGMSVRWVERDMRELDCVSEFDAVVSLFSSMGYFQSEEEDLRVLQGVRRALRPNGVFVLETMHRDQLARGLAERDWWEGADGTPVWVEREFDAVRGILQECWRWLHPGGGIGEKRHALRVRSATEWDVLLGTAGLEAVEWLGGWELEPFEMASERLIVVTRAAGTC
jgi:SAM-dependent methyltransferase